MELFPHDVSFNHFRSPAAGLLEDSMASFITLQA